MAGLEADTARGGIERVVRGGRLQRARDGDPHGAQDGFGDGKGPGCEGGAVGFGQLERGRGAVTGADDLIERGWRLLWRTGLPVHVIAPAETVQAATPFLEEGDDGVQIVERLDAEARVVGAA
jgi:hypothetical protein